MFFKKTRFLTIAIFILSATMLLGWSAPAKAWLFNPVSQITTTSFIKFKIDFSILQDIKLFQQKFQFSTMALKKSFASCEDTASVCEREYKRCLGLLKYNDQDSAEILFKLKNACVNSCSEPEECFGLDLSSGTIPLSTQFDTAFTPACTGAQTIVCQTPEGLTGTKTAVTCNALTKQWNYGVCEPNPIQTCSGPDSRSCTTAFGLPGTQQGICNTATGQYDWGTCVANITDNFIDIVVCPLPAPTCPVGYSGSYYCSNGSWVNGCVLIIKQCDANQPQCPIGYAGNYICQNGQWVNNCYLPTCSGNPPLCPSGYTGFYVCQNGQWVNQCQAPETCTSFNYSAWSECANGTQTRTVTASYPEGCTGGNPVLAQACCEGEQPPCPDGWSGSYTCANNYWYPTCVPPPPEYCYRGVKYRISDGIAYATCVGTGRPESVDGQTCNRVLNVCTPEMWDSYNTESNLKLYIDTMYQTLIPNSCDPNFVYSQCQ